MAIKVLKPGLSTTVQDLGRPGYYHLGIPLSGAMDRFALSCANLLVGNEEGAAALECTFMGPELEFTADATVAVTGAELPAKLNGTLQPGWTSSCCSAPRPKAGRSRRPTGRSTHRQGSRLIRFACWRSSGPFRLAGLSQ